MTAIPSKDEGRTYVLFQHRALGAGPLRPPLTRCAKWERAAVPKPFPATNGVGGPRIPVYRRSRRHAFLHGLGAGLLPVGAEA